MTPGHIEPLALYQQVAKLLRQRILSHELPPGAWVDEQSIASQYGISRTPLREALKVLASEGLVTLKPRRGCYVMEISERDLDEVYSIMSLLEGQCAAHCAAHASHGQLADLQAIHARLEAAAAEGCIDQFFQANTDFHHRLLDITGNRRLTAMIGDLRQVVGLSRHHSLTSEARRAESLAEHRHILACLARHDAPAAEAAMRAHLLSGRAALARSSAQGEASGPAPGVHPDPMSRHGAGDESI